MKKYLVSIVFCALLAVGVGHARHAHGASVNLSISITSPASTGITFTPAAPFSGSGTAFTAVGPIASGVTVGTISVAPTGWQGAIALSGAGAASFSLSGMHLVTAATLPAATSYALTLTATP